MTQPKDKTISRAPWINRSGQRSREKILEAASAVFARKGFADASIRDIAKEADVVFASLFHHFRSKERLFVEVVRNYLVETPRLDRFFDPLFALGETPSPREISDALHASVKNLMFLIHGPERLPAINGLLLRVFADGLEEAQLMVLEHFAPLQHRVAELLARLCPDRPEHDMEAWFSLFWAQVFYPVTTRNLRLLDRGWASYPVEWILHASHRIAWYQCLPLGLPEPAGRVEMPVGDSVKTRAAAKAARDGESR
ncbi:TetR family transcriptional regulator [Opitutaceae bacterium TAV5]|nr:TetR family transcriptional regulator [Opitutaceae bacterium TAV5]